MIEAVEVGGMITGRGGNSNGEIRLRLCSGQGMKKVEICAKKVGWRRIGYG